MSWRWQGSEHKGTKRDEDKDSDSAHSSQYWSTTATFETRAPTSTANPRGGTTVSHEGPGVMPRIHHPKPDLVLEPEHDTLEVRTENALHNFFGDGLEGCRNRYPRVDEGHVQGSEGGHSGLDDPAVVIILEQTLATRNGRNNSSSGTVTSQHQAPHQSSWDVSVDVV